MRSNAQLKSSRRAGLFSCAAREDTRDERPVAVEAVRVWLYNRAASRLGS